MASPPGPTCTSVKPPASTAWSCSKVRTARSPSACPWPPSSGRGASSAEPRQQAFGDIFGSVWSGQALAICYQGGAAGGVGLERLDGRGKLARTGRILHGVLAQDVGQVAGLLAWQQIVDDHR